jgi:hypothetical protein
MLIAGCLLLSGCGGNNPAATAPTPTGSQTQAAGTLPPLGTSDGRPVHLLYISDSSGWKTGEAYAALAQEELGVPVDLIDWRRGGLSMVDVPTMLRRLPRVVADAEIVVLWANPTGSGVNEAVQSCVGEPGEPGGYTEADWRPFEDLTGEVLDAIWELRQGKPTVLRVTDIYSPVVASEWKDRGIGEACMTAWETMSDAVRAAAEAHGATFVSALDVYNGPDHRQDPVAAGLIDADGTHPGEAGGQAMATALAATGFVPTPAP